MNDYFVKFINKEETIYHVIAACESDAIELANELYENEEAESDDAELVSVLDIPEEPQVISFEEIEKVEKSE